VDVAAERLRTPGTRQGHHLNAAGSSLPTVQTLEAVIGHLRLEARIGGYEAAALRAEELAGVYTAVADLIGAEAPDVALTDNATTAMQRVLGGLSLGPGDQVVVTPATYVSVALHLLALREAAGIDVRVAPVGEDGVLDLDVRTQCPGQQTLQRGGLLGQDERARDGSCPSAMRKKLRRQRGAAFRRGEDRLEILLRLAERKRGIHAGEHSLQCLAVPGDHG